MNFADPHWLENTYNNKKKAFDKEFTEFFNLCDDPHSQNCSQSQKFRDQSFNLMSFCFYETLELIASFFGYDKYNYKRLALSPKEDFIGEYLINPMSGINDRFWLKNEDLQI